MAATCREFDISRKTGYKIFSRYKRCGLEGLADRSRPPYRQANRLPFTLGTPKAIDWSFSLTPLGT